MAICFRHQNSCKILISNEPTANTGYVVFWLVLLFKETEEEFLYGLFKDMIILYLEYKFLYYTQVFDQ